MATGIAAGVAGRAVKDFAEGVRRGITGSTSPINHAKARGRKNTEILAYPFTVDEDEQQGHYIMFNIYLHGKGRLVTPKTAKQKAQEAKEKLVAEYGVDDFREIQAAADFAASTEAGEVGEEFNFDEGDCEVIPGECTEGLIEDCNGICAPEGWLGDGFCDDGSYEYNGNPIFFNCEEFGNDNGDCDVLGRTTEIRPYPNNRILIGQ